MCNGTPFTVKKISPQAKIEHRTASSVASALPTELPDLLSDINIEIVKTFKIETPEIIAVTVLKMEQFGFTTQ